VKDIKNKNRGERIRFLKSPKMNEVEEVVMKLSEI